jgi:LPXTG-site transpeptidase (sortase) family protein
MTVMASVGVVAAGFMPVDSMFTAQPIARRVIATPVAAPVFVPTEMTVPRLNLKGTPVVEVGTYDDGTMESPTGAVNIGWWKGRKPGQGNTLFAAHHDWSGQPGSFKHLNTLKVGDKVIIEGEGKRLVYVVSWVRNYDGDIDATKLLDNRSGKQIATLITCGGAFDTSTRHHVERVVARAVLTA